MKITKVAGEKKPLEINEVKIRDALVEDLINAERIAGKPQGFHFLLAVIAQVATFDGKELVFEDLERLKGKDFLDLSEELGLMDAEALQNELSTSSRKGSSEKKE
jgi:hypothetical protein